MNAETLTVSADALWGESKLAYHVQARLPHHARDMLRATQQMLANTIPLALHLIPTHALHVSVYALVPVRLADAGKEQHWQAIADRARADLTALCARATPLRLSFSHLRVTPSAIIAVASDASGLIANVRAHFGSLDVYRYGPPQSFDLIHCTLARFKQSGLLSREPIAAIETLPFAFACDISQLSIVRERVYPCLETDVVTSSELPMHNARSEP